MPAKGTRSKPRGYAAHPMSYTPGKGKHHVFRSKEQTRIVKRGLTTGRLDREPRCIHVGERSGQVCARPYGHKGDHRYRR